MHRAMIFELEELWMRQQQRREALEDQRLGREALVAREAELEVAKVEREQEAELHEPLYVEPPVLNVPVTEDRFLFLSETGIGPETLRSAASDPNFLASVLDFVMRDDATVKAFASQSEHHPTTIAAARQALGDPHWEREVP